MPEHPFIQVADVSFTYDPEGSPPRMALTHLDLEMQRGDYLVIVGHNGSGKSTLARHLNALLQPTSGDVWIKGMNTKNPDHLREIRSSVGMVFQVPDNQIVATVVEQDVAFGPENLGVAPQEIRCRVDWALELVGMLPHRTRPPHLLSAGQKQRVALAGVLAMKPEVLVLDEATSMLDPAGREAILDTVRRLNQEEGLTVVAITHFMDEAVDGSRVAVMARGEVRMMGTAREVFSRVTELREMMLDVPQPTELAYELHRLAPAFPGDLLTTEEVVDAIGRMRGRIAP